MPVPQYDELMNPTLKAMHLLGGKASISNIEYKVAEILSLSSSDVNEIHKGSRTKLNYRLAWSRYYLKKFGLLTKEEKGIWSLTEKGKTIKSIDKEHIKSYVKKTNDDEKINKDFDDVIYNDQDTINEDLYENDSLYPYEFIEEIDVREDPLTVFEIIRRLKKNKIIINPEFQRNMVWGLEQKSQFIESLILNIPLPPIYLYQDIKGRYILVDGLQRTTTISDFYDNKFQLKGLRALPKYNDVYFKQLEENIQTRIEDKKILIYVIKPSMPLYIVYDIFNRINTGGIQLTRQEIRNCIFLGNSTKLLKELSEENYFKKAIDWGISEKRMKDREAILRYLSFKLYDYRTEYGNDMDDFLSSGMKRINRMIESEILELKKDFKRVMKYTLSTFGDKNFRLPTKKSRGRINIALFESVCYFFSNKSDQFLNENKTIIKKNFETILKNPDFLDSIRNSTGNKKKVINRFELVEKILGNVK